MPRRKSKKLPSTGAGTIQAGAWQPFAKPEVIKNSDDYRKFGPPPYVTRGEKDGKPVDFIRCETCKGRGCHACATKKNPEGLGFTIQRVLVK